MISTICVIGAGTMGAGIAQVCAQAGYYTLLFDIHTTVLDKAATAIHKSLQFLVDKQKITAEEKEQIFKRVQFVHDTNDCLADLFIEAIVEKTEAKVAIFNQLAELNHSEVIFASNTSSLSISAIQAGIIHPSRVVGMHFFNPAPVMKLVELVKGNQTTDEVVEALVLLCKQLNKVAVVCKDSPGFIVNRIARQYYLESMVIVEKGLANLEQVDAIMEASGFKMGPFKLMDLIGMDINFAVSESIYHAFNDAKRFEPSPIQREKVAKGELGKKTGKGFYTYE